MKKLGLFNKGIFFFNSIAAAMLLLSYFLPFLPPKTFSVLSVLGLAVPFLIILNALFFLYWLLKVKKQLLLSLLVLLIGYNYVGSLYKFSSSKNVENQNNVSVMTFNVRLFNVYHWIKDNNLASATAKFIDDQDPDILSLQEYHPHSGVNLDGYPFKFEKLAGKKIKYGQAIFSKYPIVNSGSINFPNTANNAIFIDIVKNTDTLRIYNLHLQSLSIDPNVELNKKEPERLMKRIGKSFGMQQDQAALFLAHKKECPYRLIVTGDFNNTAYSYVYKKIKGDRLQDAFEMAGNGFGKTFNFKFFPVRIDFILVDAGLEVNAFKTFEDKLSDHFPIMAKFRWE